MNEILGGAGLGALEEILGVSGKSTTKARSKSKSTGGGVASLLPALLALLGSGGLEQLISMFSSNGLGDIIGSWVGGGPNKSITPGQVKKGVGSKGMKQLAAQSGLSENQVATHLATILPNLVNHLTPGGTVPNPSSLSTALAGLEALLPKS